MEDASTLKVITSPSVGTSESGMLCFAETCCDLRWFASRPETVQIRFQADHRLYERLKTTLRTIIPRRVLTVE